MKSLHYIVLVSLLSLGVLSVHGQASTSGRKVSDDAKSAPSKRGPVFRANKDQVSAAQAMLKRKGAYSGEATGKLDSSTRDALKSYQKDNGLRATGTLNRATLEKMGIALTEQQKAIPASANSYGGSKSTSANRKPRGAVFRATKDQITEVQRLLKSGGMYSGEETGKLDDPTRESVRKYQEAHGIKATGTLNQVTLEKMGIELTDRQKGSGAGQKGSDDSR